MKPRSAGGMQGFCTEGGKKREERESIGNS
jgi:hypothetical protein